MLIPGAVSGKLESKFLAIPLVRKRTLGTGGLFSHNKGCTALAEEPSNDWIKEKLRGYHLIDQTLPADLHKSFAVDERQRQAGTEIDPNVFYMKQTISNACGTIGLLHAIGNNQQHANLSKCSASVRVGIVTFPSHSGSKKKLQHIWGLWGVCKGEKGGGGRGGGTHPFITSKVDIPFKE